MTLSCSLSVATSNGVLLVEAITLGMVPLSKFVSIEYLDKLIKNVNSLLLAHE